MNFAALKTQSSLRLFAKKAITSSLEAGTCAQSPFMLLLALKGIHPRVKQSSHPEFSQNAGTCLHPSAHGWKCSVEAMQVVRLCPPSHQFPGFPQPWAAACCSHTGMGISPGSVPYLQSVQREFVSVECQCCRGTSPSEVPSVSEALKERHSAGSTHSSVSLFQLQVIAALSGI